MLAVLLSQMLKKAPEHETVGIFATSGAQKGPRARDCCHFFYFRCLKRPRSTRLLAFLLIQMLKKAPEHETVGIFANSDAQKGPGARDCWHFC